jgi:hypothetical protein
MQNDKTDGSIVAIILWCPAIIGRWRWDFQSHVFIMLVFFCFKSLVELVGYYLLNSKSIFPRKRIKFAVSFIVHVVGSNKTSNFCILI